jgi:hypothetical protein
MCVTFSQRCPMSQSRKAETLVNRPVLAAFFGDVLANLHLHRKHEADQKRIAEIRDL